MKCESGTSFTRLSAGSRAAAIGLPSVRLNAGVRPDQPLSQLVKHLLLGQGGHID